MKYELPARRVDFLPGVWITLADGQAWILPSPRANSDSKVESADKACANLAADPRYLGVLRAIVEAEDPAETLRAELALAIYLLRYNYVFEPDSLRQLLEFKLDSPELGQAQQAFHTLAREHLEWVRSRSSPPRPVSARRAERPWARLWRWFIGGDHHRPSLHDAVTDPPARIGR